LNTVFVEALRLAAGPGAKLYLGGDELELFGRDETEDLFFAADAAVQPAEREAVARIVRLAWEHGVPVTARGGGTGLSGGALPVRGGIVLGLDLLDRILEIDRDNMIVRVEPGVITQNLQEAVEAAGLFYPPDPASRGSCTMGGNLAENAGGPRAVKYGVTSDWVLGLEVVLADGSIVHTGSACRKDVTGYDMTHLFVGSEGTLGIITEATLRLIPYPSARALLLAAFPGLQEGLDGVLSVFRRVTPSVCEFLESAALEAAARHLGRPVPVPGAGSYVLLEVDGDGEEVVEAEMLSAGEALDRAGATEIVVAQNPRQTEELWALRRAAGEAVKALSTYKEEDCVVPRARIADLVRGVKEIARKHGITTICYGHAGDGNIHVNVLRMDADERSWEVGLPRAVEEIFRLTVSLGGTISGEHGIGYSQRRYLSIRMSQREIELHRTIKAALDPRGILNPGKIFPE